MRKLVGLSGGIATGKSTTVTVIADLFCKHSDSNKPSPPNNPSIAIIDCDSIARGVVEPGRWGYKRVVAEFSEESSRGHRIILDDGSLDRDSLANMIFSDNQARKRLQRALHLPIFVDIVHKILSYWWSGSFDIVLIDMPLLFETKFYLLTKPYNIVITCDENEQIHRLCKRDGLSVEDAMQRVHAQMPTRKKSAMAEYTVSNEDITINELQEKMSVIFSKILSDQSQLQPLRSLVAVSLLALPLIGLISLMVLILRTYSAEVV